MSEPPKSDDKWKKWALTQRGRSETSVPRGWDSWADRVQNPDKGLAQALPEQKQDNLRQAKQDHADVFERFATRSYTKQQEQNLNKAKDQDRER